MLAGDYMCFNTLALERGSDPQCKLCLPGSDIPAPSEDIIHILTSCRGTADMRSRIFRELLNVVYKFFPTFTILDTRDEHTLTQFILDCCSPNLPILTRLDPIQPDISHVFKSCRDMKYSIHSERIRKSLGYLKFK